MPKKAFCGVYVPVCGYIYIIKEKLMEVEGCARKDNIGMY